MKSIAICLLSAPYFALLVSKANIEECCANGKIYTVVRGKAVDSIDVSMKFRQIETIKDIDLRIKEKERVLEIIKTKHCKF